MKSMCPIAADPDQPFACYKDWNVWLSIDPNALGNGFFVLDLFTLVLAYMTRYFMSDNER